MRKHGTTRCRPAEVFAIEEQPKLKPLPDEPFDIPTWTHPKVASDRHVQIARALDSVPGQLVGRRLDARVDTRTVKLYWRGELIKVHPVVGPGRRRTDPADLPAQVSAYAMRDLNTLQRQASAHGAHVGAYAAAVLEHPPPWTCLAGQHAALIEGVVPKGEVVFHHHRTVEQLGPAGAACTAGLLTPVVS